MHIIKSTAAMSCVLIAGCSKPTNVNKTINGTVSVSTVEVYNSPGATNYSHAMTSVVQDYFETGVMLGYECANHGGTTNDAKLFIRAMRDRKPELIRAWFEAR
jgi:hypothetical protein